MRRSHTFNSKLALSLLTLLSSACIRKSATSQRDQGQTPSSTNATPVPRVDTYPEIFGFGSIKPLTERNALGQKFTEASLNDVLLSLAFCECSPRLQTKLILDLNGQRGALPQALTPAVRREILSNPKLKILNIVPRPLDDFVGGIFDDEQSVADEISKGLLEKIKTAEPTWAVSPETPALQLDGFPPLPGTLSPSSGRTVRLLDVWSRWALIYAHGGPWSSVRSTSPNPGLLWHELLRSLAEGEYLFGLAGTGEGQTWGGLTIPVDLQINNPGPYDPRTTNSQVRFLTGQLDLTLSSNNSLSLARYGGDRWTWRENSILLAEQSVQWWVAARMLNRLRPLNRGPFANYFPSMIPDDAYQLSLLVLPALDALLSARFIDENSRAIRSYIRGAQVGGVAPSVRERADPQTLSFLLIALSAWSQELSSVADLNVSRDTMQQLKSAPNSLLKGAQLIVQTLLGESLGSRPSNSTELSERPASLYLNPRSPEQGELSLRDQAQVLHALVNAEKNLMPSPYLRGRLTQLARGLAERWQVLSDEQKTQQPFTQMVWTKSALDQFLAQYPDTNMNAALKNIQADINQRLHAFEEGALQ